DHRPGVRRGHCQGPQNRVHHHLHQRPTRRPAAAGPTAGPRACPEERPSPPEQQRGWWRPCTFADSTGTGAHDTHDAGRATRSPTRAIEPRGAGHAPAPHHPNERETPMRTTLTAATLALTTACGTTDDGVPVDRATFEENRHTWPLTVDEGTIHQNNNAIYFED